MGSSDTHPIYVGLCWRVRRPVRRPHACRQPVVRLWLGNDFVPSTTLLAAAALWTVVFTSSTPLAFFLNGNERFRPQLVAGVPMVICNSVSQFG